VNESPNTSMPWMFSDGACNDLTIRSGGGYVLFLSPTHSFHAKMGFGLGTNNNDELMA